MNEAWTELKQACAQCRRCGLGETRHHLVFGDGAEDARIMLIGEGPGEQEDLQGLPFVGPAGKLLDDMLEMIYLDRTKVYIANIVKCRPPHNRGPQFVEQKCCSEWLRRQIALVDPAIIVCLGRIAATALIKDPFRITREHGPALYGNLSSLRPAARHEQAAGDICRPQDAAARDLCPLPGGVSRCLMCISAAPPQQTCRR